MADFQEHLLELSNAQARIVALSSDDETGARDMVQSLGLQFDVGYGLDPETTSHAIGCYSGERQSRRHLQPAAFVLTSNGTVAHAVYSSGKVGRLTADDALTVISNLSGEALARD